MRSTVDSGSHTSSRGTSVCSGFVTNTCRSTTSQRNEM